MKILQDVRHWATKRALTMPVIRGYVSEKLVSMHSEYFLDRAPPTHRPDRRDRLEDFFEMVIDSYLVALQEGHSEAAAREMTHVQTNFDFYNHGWTEMMEFPVDELKPHFDRYAAFFERHNITIEDPLGEFRPADGISPAPSTPEKLDEPEHPHARAGFADDVYVRTGDGDLVIGGQSEPEKVDTTEAPGVDSSILSVDDSECGE